MIAKNVPLYNLKAVLKETGIKADVLRAWERRYGLPMPDRSGGGHRLYSQRDIDIIKWLMARQAEGLSISRAVELWRDIESEGRDPLTDSLKPDNVPSFSAPGGATPLGAVSNLDQLRQQWLQACMAYNEMLAESLLNQALAMYPPEMVVSEVLQRGLHDIGELWFQNKATVQQEHFASALAMRRVDTLLSGTPMPAFAQSIIVACPPNEWHTFTPLMLSLFLRRRGWNVIYLGANNPNARLLETVRAIQPRLIILSSQQLPTAATLMKTAAELTEKGVQVAYGGRIFNVLPELRRRIHGHFLGETVEDAMLTVDQLVKHPRTNPEIHPVDHLYIEALESFTAKRGMIELSVADYYRARNLSSHHLQHSNEFFGDILAAALALGDINYINPDLDWLRNLMIQYDYVPDRIYPYINAYVAAMQQHMGAHAQMIMDWAAQHAPAG